MSAMMTPESKRDDGHQPKGEGNDRGDILREKFIWCLVASITREVHPDGPDGNPRLGLKHLAPGAKVYCFPIQWGDGGERLRAIGRHRGGGPRLIEIVVATKWLTDWRVQKVFHPRIVQAMQGYWDDTDAGREKALSMLACYKG
jgi:hypothetical protein